MARLAGSKFIRTVAILLLATAPSSFAQTPQPDDDRSQYVGKKTGTRLTAFEARSTKQQPLIGFEFGVGGRAGNVQVAAVRPIFKGDTKDRPAVGLFQDATVRDRKMKTLVTKTEKVVAKDGYAVSGLSVRTGLWIDAVRVHFARVKGDALDPTDSYESDWYGAAGKGNGTPLASDGRLVIGVTGAADDVKAVGIGLVYPPKPATVAAEPKAPPAAKPEPKAAEPKAVAAEPKAKPAQPMKATPEQQVADFSKQFEEKAKAAAERQQAEVQKFADKLPKAETPPADLVVLQKLCEEMQKRDDLTPQEQQKLDQMVKMLSAAGVKVQPKASPMRTVAVGFIAVCVFGTVGVIALLLVGGPRTKPVTASDDTPYGTTAETVSPEELQPLHAELTPDERILWSGKQSPVVLWKGRIAMTAVLGGIAAALGGFALLVASAKSGDAVTTVLPLVFMLIGTGLLAFVGVANFSRFGTRTRAVYALTNRRALVYRAAFFGEGRVDSYGPGVLQDMRRRDYWLTKDAGDLIFRTERTVHVTRSHGRTSSHETERRFGFLGVDNVREVEKLVRETLVNPLVDKMLV